MKVILLSAVLLSSVLGAFPAFAGGLCILHPKPFTLRSDTVHWSMRIRPGDECIQGLRWSTIIIDAIGIEDPPKRGRLLIQGPSFRYQSNGDARGADSFKIAIKGTSLHVSGTSLIEVDVTPE